ncbi:MAG: penicillin-binding transpeptidase domain-containing protein [Chloroflexota bacterium]|nr:penicillin-binding transpeptidase domain-containing protein [Chloroflexota bacterium]
MTKKRLFLALMLLLTLVACSTPPATIGTDEPVPGTPTLPGPQVDVTPAPEVETMIDGFMRAWQLEDYPVMYSYLTAESQSAITLEDFALKYNNTAVTLTLQQETGIEYAITDRLTNPNNAAVTVQVNYNTNLFGTLARDLTLALVREDGGWRLQWTEATILPDLQGGNTLEIVRDIPARGNIYANDGSAIVSQEDVVALGFVPNELDTDRMSLFYSTMADLTIYQIDEIIEMVDNALGYEYIPLGEVPQEEVDRRIDTLNNALTGVYINYYTSRYYVDNGIAPQTVGHLSYVPSENPEDYLRQGYALNSRFGSTGIELAYDDELAGTMGASLYLKDVNGQIVTKLAERGKVAAQAVTTTIDPTLQYLLQKSLGDYRGAIVVMEMDTGRVLASVSNPQFDPNLFDGGNENIFHIESPYNQPDDPVFNRATDGQYPLGSVFKIITMSAALETGVFTETSEIYCGHSIDVCGGTTLYDWTYEKERPESGQLTLPEGLMRSCNPWFYYIGETLAAQGYTNAIADLARDFGLGSLTGVDIPEQPGNIPVDTSTCELNTQLAIGQGEMTVTPLQVARFVAAIGNGGTLYRPALVESVGVEGLDPTYTFEPEAMATLPISDSTLRIVQEAMRSVISNGRGTAHAQLGTMTYRAYGKTGTAQNPFGDSHAWFAGYTSVGNPDRPDIAVAVLLENAGEGSEMAAPVFRRVVSLYFSNYTDYGYVLPWEAYPYVVASPTPVPTDTPYGYEETDEP